MIPDEGVRVPSATPRAGCSLARRAGCNPVASAVEVRILPRSRVTGVMGRYLPASGNGITAVFPKDGCLVRLRAEALSPRISLAWEAACKTA